MVRFLKDFMIPFDAVFLVLFGILGLGFALTTKPASEIYSKQKNGTWIRKKITCPLGQYGECEGRIYIGEEDSLRCDIDTYFALVEGGTYNLVISEVNYIGKYENVAPSAHTENTAPPTVVPDPTS